MAGSTRRDTTGFRQGLLSLLGKVAMAVAMAAPVLSALGYAALSEALLVPAIKTMMLIGVLVLLQRLVFDLWTVATGSEDLARDALLPGATLVTVRQVHSADCVTVSGPIAEDDRPSADAMATDRPGLVLGILTADCVPVLFADTVAGVVGAAHAGWKGAIGGVTDATIAAMETLGARSERIACAIGPCIGRASYEVTDAFALRFEADDPANERFFSAGRPGHRQFDIAAYVAARLAGAGIGRPSRSSAS